MLYILVTEFLNSKLILQNKQLSNPYFKVGNIEVLEVRCDEMFLRIKFFILRNNLLYRKEGQLTIVNSIKKAEQSQMIVCRVVGPINPELYKFDFMTYYQTL